MAGTLNSNKQTDTIVRSVLLQPSAAKQIMNFDDNSRDGEERKDLSTFGLRTDIYAKKSQKVRTVSFLSQSSHVTSQVCGDITVRGLLNMGKKLDKKECLFLWRSFSCIIKLHLDNIILREEFAKRLVTHSLSRWNCGGSVFQDGGHILELC